MNRGGTNARHAWRRDLATVANALEARRSGDLGRARRLLSGLAPKHGQEDLRGLEWRLLNGLCAGDSIGEWKFADAPEAVSWIAARKQLAIVDAARRLHFFDLASGKIRNGPLLPNPRAEHIDALDHGFHSLSFSADGRHFACSDGDVLLVCETETGRLLHSAAARHIGSVWLDENRLLYGGNVAWAAVPRPEPTSIFDVRDGSRLALPKGIFAPFAVSLDRNRLALTIADDNNARVEIRTRLEDAASTTLKSAPDEDPALLAFSAGNDLAVATSDGGKIARRVRVYSRDQMKVILREEFPRMITAMAFDPQNSALAVASEDAAIRLLDGYKSEQKSLPGHDERVGDLAFPSGGAALFSVSNDGTMRQWAVNAPSQTSLADLATEYSWLHPTASHNGARILYVNRDDRAANWERTSGKRSVFPEDHHPLGALRDGRMLTRIGATGEVVMWQLDNEHPRELWRARDRFIWVHHRCVEPFRATSDSRWD